MQVLIVSGFLGSGKTTFIRQLAEKTGRQFVVYENEYGQADIDAKVLRDDADLKVWESTENCICCSGKQDFASSVLTISNTLDPDFLVVEPTGVAKLSAVVANVQSVAWERIELLSPLCIVDACAWRREHEQWPDIFDDQVASAGTLVVSKQDRAGDLTELAGWLHEQRPDAATVLDSWDRLPDSWWQGLLRTPLGASEAVPESNDSEGPDLETLSLSPAELPTPAHLIWLLDALAAGAFGAMARAKGWVRCGSELLRFDLVDRAWSITGTDTEETPTAVFIGQGLEREALANVFVPEELRAEAEHHEHDHVCHEHGCHGHDHEHGHHHR